MRASPALQRFLVPGAVVALGLVSLTLLVLTNWIRERLLTQHVALVQAVGEIQSCEAQSHLWLEEYVSGDLIHREDAWENQHRSLELVHAMLEGGSIGRGRDRLLALRDPALRARVVAMRSTMERFHDVALAREHGLEEGLDVGIGSALDREYDAVFGEVLTDLRAFEGEVNGRLRRAHERSVLIFRAILVAWIAIVAIAVRGLWSRERRRVAAEEALRESQARLLQSQKLEAVGRVAGGLAHDTNNYLAAIIAQCELARAGDVSPADRLVAIQSTATRAAVLIRRLLSFGRRESVQPRVVDLNRSVRELHGMLTQVVSEAVSVRLQLSEDVWHTLIDPIQLEQVLVNLVVNAHEASRSGDTITIETHNATAGELEAPLAREDDAEYVCLSVTDTGAGIPPELLERIFDPFVTTKDSSESVGLGLATVYGIVEQAGGAIRVHSELEHGTRVRVYLPSCHEPAHRAAGVPQTPLARGTQRLMLIEDNDELREATSESLRGLGYSVISASNGVDAIERFDSSIELVITDVVMPGLDGAEALARMRAHSPQLPAIFVSGFTDDVVLRHGIREDEVHFLSKPFLLADLAAEIRSALATRAPLPGAETSANTVLIADDDPLLRAGLARVVERAGFHAVHAADGREALASLKSARLDCAVLDVGLPEVGGRDLLQRTRRLAPGLPVVLVTGSVGRELAETVARDPATRVLQKPFESDRLLATLRELIDARDVVYPTRAPRENDRPGSDGRVRDLAGR